MGNSPCDAGLRKRLLAEKMEFFFHDVTEYFLAMLSKVTELLSWLDSHA